MLQVAVPVLPSYLPAAQTVQELVPPTAYVPTEHAEQLEVPELDAYVPVAQLEHELAEAVENVPKEQEMQLIDVVADIVAK